MMNVQTARAQFLQLGMKEDKMMKPKNEGAGIMVSDFVDEHNGFLVLNDEEHDRAKVSINTYVKF